MLDRMPRFTLMLMAILMMTSSVSIFANGAFDLSAMFSIVDGMGLLFYAPLAASAALVAVAYLMFWRNPASRAGHVSGLLGVGLALSPVVLTAFAYPAEAYAGLALYCAGLLLWGMTAMSLIFDYLFEPLLSPEPF